MSTEQRSAVLKAKQTPIPRHASQWMAVKVRMWLVVFRVRAAYRRLRWWWLGRKTTWMIVLQVRYARWKRSR